MKLELFFSHFKKVLLLGAPLFCFFMMSYFASGFLGTAQGRFLLLSFWMLIWWAFEVVPIPVTSLIPIVFFPLCGVMPEKEVFMQYSKPIIFLFMGGFFLAKALEKTRLHKRFALKVLELIGGNYQRTLLAFMVTTFFLSMWISNTATTLLMLAVASGVLLFLEKIDQDQIVFSNFSKALLLCIAYSASVGGVATLIGTPPNGFLAAYLKENHNFELSMLEWIKSTFPFVLIVFVLLWVWLTQIYFRFPQKNLDLKSYLAEEQKKLGAISCDEKVVMAVLLVTAFCWVIRKEFVSLTGLSISDAAIAMGASLVLFSWPSKTSKNKKDFILDWTTGSKIPWGILLMFGGGLSIAHGFKSTGLTNSLVNSLDLLPDLNPFVLLSSFSLVTLGLTEILTNSAAVATLLPVLTIFSERYDLVITYLAIPCTICCSLAFMLPIATPPNALVFSQGKIKLKDMFFCGLGFNLVVLAVVFVFFGLV